MKTLSALLVLCIVASGASASTLELLRSASQHGRDASTAGSSDSSKWKATYGWDRTGSLKNEGDTVISPPLLPEPVGPTLKKPTANLIVGTPGAFKVREPKNPLTEDGKAKKQSSGNKFWWALGGALAGAGLGFMLFGPIGALIGGLAAGIAGFIYGP